MATRVAIPTNVNALLALDAGGLPVELEQVTLLPATVAGATPAPAMMLRGEQGAWTFPGATGDSTVAAMPRVQFNTGPAGLEQIILRVRLRKPADPALWSIVERSYRSLLNTEGLERARRGTVVMANEIAADAVRRPE